MKLYKNIGWLLLTLMIIAWGCSGPRGSLFSKQTPHEAYEKKLQNADLLSSALGQSWQTAASSAIKQPLSISLPYQETGYFAAEAPSATGLVFDARRGQKIDIQLQTTPASGFPLFVDLFEVNTGAEPKHISSAENDSLHLLHEIDSDGQLLIRIQPELLKNGSYTLMIQNKASMVFPVPSVSTSAIGSFWGNSRDAGARSHEGIDIFAKRGTPVSAAADGVVTRVGENNLGGKIVFMRPNRKAYSLYYAHLDSQLVATGDAVKTGDVLGYIGNTGNARTTAPHLHFGIYSSSGAVDPLPFVKPVTEKPGGISSDTSLLNTYAYTAKQTTAFNGPSTKADSSSKILAEVPVHIIGATGNWLKVELPGKQIGYVVANDIKTATVLKKITTKSDHIGYTMADMNSIPKTRIEKGATINIYGVYNGFYFVKNKQTWAWIKIPATN